MKDLKEEEQAHVMFIVATLSKLHIKEKNVIDVLTTIINIVQETKNFSGKKSSSKRAMIVQGVVEELAKGKDGIMGTSDDIISESTYKQLIALQNESLVAHFVSFLMELRKKRFDYTRFAICLTKTFI
jgi:hypothetical protein